MDHIYVIYTVIVIIIIIIIVIIIIWYWKKTQGSTRLHFYQKYSKISKIVKYYYKLK